MSHVERIAVTASLALLSFLLLILVPLGSQRIAVTVLGSELSVQLSWATGVALLTMVIIGAGADATLLCLAPRELGSLAYRSCYWPLPVLLGLLAVVLIDRVSVPVYQLFLAASASLLLALVLALQCRDARAGAAPRRPVHVALTVTTYAVALALFGILYEARLRSLLSATAILALSALLCLELYRSPTTIGRSWVYAGIGGLVMGELTWALNHASVANQYGGGFLLLAYYGVTSLVRQHLIGALRRAVVIEAAFVVAMGLALLALYSRL